MIRVVVATFVVAVWFTGSVAYFSEARKTKGNTIAWAESLAWPMFVAEQAAHDAAKRSSVYSDQEPSSPPPASE